MVYIKSNKFKKHEIKNKLAVGFNDLDNFIAKSNLSNELTPIPPPRDWEKTDTILLKCDGYWWIHSKVDRRWIAEGKGTVGGKEMCFEAKKKFQEMKEKYKMVPWDIVYRIEPRNFKNFVLAEDI